MNDISTAERRLIAALDRLDHTVERTARRLIERPAPSSAPATPQPAEAEVSAEVAALHARQAATVEAMQMRLAEANERLASAGDEAARLAAANDELARANRALLASGGISADDAITALEAEIEALHAARAAEIAQMGEILDALDRMLGVTTTPRSHSTAAKAARSGRRVEAEPARPVEKVPTADLTVMPDDDELAQQEFFADKAVRDAANDYETPSEAADLDDQAIEAVETDYNDDSDEDLPESYDDEERR